MTARVALLADHLEEGWASMDHYAAMLEVHVPRNGPLACSVLRPPFRNRLRNLPFAGPRYGRVLDLYWNRYLDCPRWAAGLEEFGLFHVLDQTYAHVAKHLPAGRTVVTCHDLDFIDPPPGTRKAWLVRATGRLALAGLRTAARVICDSDATRVEILERGWTVRERIVVVPLGVEEEFRPDGPRALVPEVEAALARMEPGPRVLHVGGMLARKRIDLLLRAFAAIRRAMPGATLLRAGGALDAERTQLARDLDIERAIVTIPFVSRAELAAVFRRADVFLLPSDREGFGLPVLEAMASGLPVVARDLLVVREVAGDAVRRVTEVDPEAFAAAAIAVLRDPVESASLRTRGLERVQRYRWAETARRTTRVYEEVLAELNVLPSSSP